MVTVKASSTQPINPPGTPGEEILTPEEVWAVLVHKARDPIEFVKVIDTCRVANEERDEMGQLKNLTRMVVFKGDPTELAENVEFIKPLMVDFKTPSKGHRVTNIITHGGDYVNKPDEVYLTFTFEWSHPNVKQGDEEYKKLAENYQKNCAAPVAQSITVARQMKVEGKLNNLVKDSE